MCGSESMIRAMNTVSFGMVIKSVDASDFQIDR